MIYLCRHGQTDYNRDRRIQGQLDSTLTSLGERQAAAMADLLHTLVGHDADVPWRIVASPARRTRATADIIAAKLGRSVAFDKRLVEVGLGAWEGRLRADIARETPNCFDGDEWCFRGPGGESFEDVHSRVGAWLSEQAREPERRLIVVSHGVAGRLLRGIYAGFSRAEMLRQDVPQDAIFRLYAGTVERLACAPVSGE